jgi:hypothetical protein
VHIPSFSLDEWNRLSTHHMVAFEAQLSRIWRSHSKAVILVVPTVSNSLLNEYFKLLPIAKPELHIIVPDNIGSFPSYLPLASILYYSHLSMVKIKEIIGNRKAYIVPGMTIQTKPEVLLSYHLKLPLYCTDLKVIQQWSLLSNKLLFKDVMLPTLPYQQVEPNCSMNMLAALFLALIVKYPTVPVWLFKIDMEFLGRGIASLCVH